MRSIVGCSIFDPLGSINEVQRDMLCDVQCTVFWKFGDEVMDDG